MRRSRKTTTRSSQLKAIAGFEGLQSFLDKDLTRTISALGVLSRFIIADLTDPISVPHELSMIAATNVVPIQTILLKGQQEYAMFVDLTRRYHWVLAPYEYESKDSLIAQLNESVIDPAEAMAKELTQSKRLR